MNENESKKEELASEKILTKKDIESIRSRATWFIKQLASEKEQKYANGLLRQYLAMIEPATRSQLELIGELIFQEIMKYRVMSREPKDDHSFRQFTELLRRIEFKIVDFKKELGIIKTEKS